MLKLYRNVLAAGVVALGLAACGDKVTVTNPPTPTPVVHSVTVVPASVTLTAGQTATFVASVVADSGLSSAVTWTSTAAATIVTITTNSAGQAVVTAVGAGQATIIATSTADPTKSGAGSVSVQALPSNILAFSVNPTNASIAVGGTLQVNPSVTTSAGAPAATISYASSSVATATVSASGQITGVANGTAIITATATSGTQSATATVGVTVGTGPQGVVSFSVSPSSMTLFATQTQQATATVVSPGFTYPVTWTSLAPTVATVSGTGLVTAVAQGTAVVTATIGTSPNTLTQSIVVNVAQGASISIASITAGATAGTPGCAGVVGAPVILTNVNCQIDVNMNLNAGVQPLDSLVVRVRQPVTPTNPTGFKRVGGQVYGNTIPSSGLVTISVNTANFTKIPTNSTVINGITYPAGTVAVDMFNGPSTVQTQVYPHLGTGGIVFNCQVGATDATCSLVNSVVINNTDGWAADIQKCSAGTGTIAAVTPVCPAAAPSTGLAGATAGTNTSTGGFANDVGGNAGNVGLTYWGGPTASGQTTAEIYAVIYNDNPSFPSGSSQNRCNNTLGNNTGCINTVTWSLGSPVPNTAGNTAATIPNAGQWCAAATQTVLPFRRTFGTGAGSTSSCNNYENVTPIRDNIDITASVDGVNNPFTVVGTLTGTAVIAGPANPNFTLIPNAVVPGATPDSARYDYKFSGTVTAPTVVGAEGQNWINKNWLFKPAGTLITDGGVGPAAATWAAFCSNTGAPGSICAQGTSLTFTTAVVTGNDAFNVSTPLMVETNTNTAVDGFNTASLGTDLLGNGGGSGATAAFGVDRTSPLVRISIAGVPSSEGVGVYTGGGAGGTSVLDSTVYNAVQGVYGALVATVGARDQFISAAYGTGDSLRIESTDNRSGVYRAIGQTNRFAQSAPNGANVGVNAYNCLLSVCGLPGTVDGWIPSPAMHIVNGAVGTGLQATPGYYTTYEYVVDKAGNVSGCPITVNISGSVCTASVASTTATTNPAMTGGFTLTAGSDQNLFGRRTLALDPGQPAVTGVSPNNNYAGNSPQTWQLGTQDDLEVIDARFRILYPNLTTGTNAETVPAANAGGLVWTYALSNTFMASGFSGGPASVGFAGATAGAGTNFGFFPVVGTRFDGAVNALPGNGLGIVNPLLVPVTLDQFTLNVQETCTNAAPPGTGLSSAMAVSTQCNAGLFVGDPIPTSGAGSTALQKPTNVGAQVRDVFGSWVFNDNNGATAVTGVAAELVTPILSATVAAPGGYGVTYYNAGATTSCPAGGAVQLANTTTCVFSGINFRGDLFYSTGSTKVYRSTEKISNTLPVFTRVEIYGLNALGQWVFISRITVPQGIGAIPTGAGCPAGTPPIGVVGCDNGNERYWFFTFSTAGATFTSYRAIGVNSSGFGLASTTN